MNETERVRRQYSHEGNLETRRSVWQPTADGRDPVAVAAEVVREARPRTILEVGCGTGAFAERLAAENPDAEVVAIDQSARFIEMATARGVDARAADVQNLPFTDDPFDLVTAMWMLYHVPDLDRGLTEIRRVLRPGGLFVAVTNGNEHTAGLRRDAGGAALVTTFSSENGEAALLRHFDVVRREDLATRAIFADRAHALAYLDTLQDGFDWRLPEFEGPREYAGHVTVFLAE